MPSINTAEDLLTLLRENKEFREAVRQAILTEELLTLPAVFNAFVSEVRGEFAGVHGEFAEVRGEFVGVHGEFAEIREELRKHTNDIGELKGIGLETKLYNRGVGLIATLLKVRDSQRVRVAERDDNSVEFNDAIYASLESGALTEEEYDRIMDTDMIVSSRRQGSPNPVYSAIEASYAVSRRDIAKVKRTAAILRKIFHKAEIHAALYYMNIAPAIQEEAAQEEVHLLKVRSLLN